MLMDLLFGSYRQRVLSLLLLHPDSSYYVRELARLTGTSAGTLHKELTRLAQAGLIQADIDLTLNPSLGIPLGFAVPDKTNPGWLICRDFHHGSTTPFVVNFSQWDFPLTPDISEAGILSTRGGLS